MSLSSPKMKSKVQKQDVGENTPFQKYPYKCDGKAARRGNFAQQKMQTLQLCSSLSAVGLWGTCQCYTLLNQIYGCFV